MSLAASGILLMPVSPNLRVRAYLLLAIVFWPIKTWDEERCEMMRFWLCFALGVK